MRFIGLMAVFAVVVGVTGIARAQTSDLVGMLTSQLGVSSAQAAGGAGSLFSFAQGQMSPTDFGTVSSALPEVGGLMDAAPSGGSGAAAAGSSLMGGTSLGGTSLGGTSLGGTSLGGTSLGGSSLGGSSMGGLGDIAGVTSAFSDLGLSPDMVQQFVPVVLDYAQSTGGSQIMQLLQGAFTAF